MEAKLIVHEGLYVKKSKLHGWGVFTDKEIKKGTIIEECVVPYDLISLDSNTLEHYRFIWPNRHTYTDGCLPLGFGAIYNHSEEPSVDWDVDDKKRVVTFTALRDIMVGEELLFDYKYNTESDF